MSQVNEILKEKMESQIESQNVAEQEADFTPIFDEIKNVTPDGALNVLIQAAAQAQAAGALTVRDSVMVASAIAVLRPGSI
jgi:aspartate/glutamate racemase